MQTSVGVHPHVAAEVDDAAWAALIPLASDPLVVAVGETGLDYDRGFSPRAAQLANLRRHLALAWEVRKPLILHCRSKDGERDAQDELLRELRAAGVGGRPGRIGSVGDPPPCSHSFSGPVDYAETALAMGCASASVALVFRRGEEASADRRLHRARHRCCSPRPISPTWPHPAPPAPQRAALGRGHRAVGGGVS